jgi:selenocysteine lyase/cysteine desulfurase
MFAGSLFCNSMIDWNNIRNYFPACKKFVYLNAAGGSPVSVQAADAARQFYNEIEQEGDTLYDDWLERTESVRRQLAAFVNAAPDEIAFTQNTSHGMNIVAAMNNPDGEVLTMDDEFPSSTYPWMNAGYKVHFVKPVDGAYPIEHIERHITPKTKILVSSYIQYNTGYRQNIARLGALCEKYGLVFVLNATQAIGAFPMDMELFKVDYMVFTGLKWPMAGYGVGGLFVNKKHLVHKKMPFAGWQSVDDPELMDNKTLKLKLAASSFEVGCPHFPNIFALGAALELLNSIGQAQITSRILDLSRYFVDRLKNNTDFDITSPLQDKSRSGIVVFKCDDPASTVHKLAAQNIIVSKRGVGIRVAFHIFNNEKDVDALINALQ